jgi:predicted dehydrogenase
MPRLGIIGIENSHTDHFIRHLNQEQRFDDSRVVAIVRGEDARVETLTAADPLQVVDSPAELVDLVDAAIVCSRDGSLHPQQAEPLLAAGKPVLIDKPLATSLEAAEALLRRSAEASVQPLSASAVRFTPQVEELLAARERTGLFHAVSVTGPADPTSPYAGIFFYGIHTVETALLLAGAGDRQPNLDDLVVRQQDAVIVAMLEIGGVLVTMRFVAPDEHGQVPFHAAVYGRHGSLAKDLILGPDYNLPLLERFMTILGGGSADVGGLSLLTPVAVTERIGAVLRPTDPRIRSAH